MSKNNHHKKSIRRLKVIIQGAVQGVGFRPFVFRLATSLSLTGWVINSSQGVLIEIEGNEENLNTFLLSIEKQKPPHAFIQSLEFSYLDPVGHTVFEVRKSDTTGKKTALILPDIGTCSDCLSEIFDPDNSRYLYPFTNCTNCGPRFSIIKKLPYDRPNTSMADFIMCDKCQAEYTNPLNRRFHAQPNACPECGPHLELWDTQGNVLASHHQALLKAADAVREGLIVAVKGIGGFHLMVDASNEEAVRCLRRRKQKEEKPLAMMYPSLSAVTADCYVNKFEERLLCSSEAPIILLHRRQYNSQKNSAIAISVAPDNPYFGIMLPYSPLHHILMFELGFPIVATSGNLSEDPLCIDEYEALDRLKNIADLLLVHNRPIVRHVDDSIVSIRMQREQILRRARGYAPLPIHLNTPLKTVLSVGAHLKNTIALTIQNTVFTSQHIGDLETPKAYEAFEKVITDFKNLYDISPEAIACDLHPTYLSTQFAQRSGLPVIPVQHHYAHILSCMAENHLEAPLLGIAWDGTGYGPDGTIWGGEFLKIESHSFQRVAHWRTFTLPGGDIAVKEPRRSAIGLLYEIFGEALFSSDRFPPIKTFSEDDLHLLQTMMKKQLNTFTTSSVGRLFDAVASLLDVRQHTQFEGQAAMSLEFMIIEPSIDKIYPLNIIEPSSASPSSQTHPSKTPLEALYIVDWEPMVKAILEDRSQQVPLAIISAMFHNTLVDAVLKVAHRIGEKRVVLSGGCFQNKYLTEKTMSRLHNEGFQPYCHQRIPPNDGGIALGQALGAFFSNQFPDDGGS